MAVLYRVLKYSFLFWAGTAVVLGFFFYAGGSLPLRAQTTDSVTERQRQLEAELDQILKEIDAQSKILNDERQKGASLERDIAILNAQIAKAKLNIRAHNIAIEGLGKDIGKKTETINELSARIEKNKESLGELIRKTNEIDSYTLVEVVLADPDLSQFFQDVDSFKSIQASLQVSVNQIKKDKSQNEAEKDSLNKKRLEEIDARISVEGEKRKIEVAEAEKKRLLGLSKQQQMNYTIVLADRQRKAAQIRSALFALRDTAAIPFGKALEYANAASKATGVRPAFILGILKQESDLGRNVGQCYLTDPVTGSGVGKNTGTPFLHVMKPDRDVPIFLDLAQRLGFNPYSQAVSCPQSVGYGGAMGPSQFIASTWVKYEGRVSQALGVATANPWNAEHAFMATGLFLSDLGASAGGYSAEQEAAGRYYAGGAWATRGLGYANSVLTLARTIQETMIDPLQGL